MAAFLLSNLVGLARQILISRTFGTGGDLDAFYAAQRLPDILFNLAAGGALASAFIPTFTGFLTRDERDGAWRLAGGVLNLVVLALTLTGVLAAALAPWLVAGVLAPGFAQPKQALTVDLLRVLLIATVLFGASGLLMGILNAHQKFLLPALAPTFYWLGMIVGLLAWAPAWGIFGLAWGAVLGAALHLAIQLPGLARLPAVRYRLSLEWNSPAVREVFRLMGPRLIGVAAVQLNFLVTTSLASFMLGGSVAALNYAWQIFTMPQVVIAQAVAVAALPTFSAQIARGQRQAMRASLADTMRGILFLAAPATVGLWLLRTPIITLLFERQRFDSESTALVAWALAFFTLGLASHSIVEILSRAFYALLDTRTPVAIGASAMVLNVALNFGLAWAFARAGWAPHGGLALANSAATTLEMIALAWIMARRLDGLESARVWAGAWRAALAAAVMGLALVGWLNAAGGRSVWLVAPGGVVLGGLVFWIAALALRCPEARLIPAMLIERLGRRKVRSAD